MFALNQDPPADEFVTSTELGRDIETSLTAMLSKLDSLEKTIGKSVDNINVGMNKLEQSILEIEAREAAASALNEQQENDTELTGSLSSPMSEHKS